MCAATVTSRAGSFTSIRPPDGALTTSSTRTATGSRLEMDTGSVPDRPPSVTRCGPMTCTARSWLVT